ncbi:MAG: hypothetical protein HXY30_02790 [Pseudorhodoplanes sp.]|nr:hypothetical protein [Pseudorhodoplanes sp.]
MVSKELTPHRCLPFDREASLFADRNPRGGAVPADALFPAFKSRALPSRQSRGNLNPI